MRYLICARLSSHYEAMVARKAYKLQLIKPKFKTKIRHVFLDMQINQNEKILILSLDTVIFIFTFLSICIG